MLGTVALGRIAADLRAARGLAGKRDIAAVAARLSLSADPSSPSVTTAQPSPTVTAICCLPSKVS